MSVAPLAPPPAVGPALQRLRAATWARHAVLDAAMPLSRPAPDAADYAAHLRLLRAWLQPLEAWLQAGPAPEGLAPVQRLPLIDADLRHPSLPQDPPAPMDDGAPWPEASEAYRWGVRYVVEGAQLGGWTLYRALQTRLAPHPLAYLAGGGSPQRVGARWQAVLKALERALPDEASQQAACQGARDAFDRLIALNERCGSPA